MATYKGYFLTIVTLLFSLTLFAENKLGIVNDTCRFTYVRGGQSNDFKIIDTLYVGDFFYYQLIDNSDWAKVTAWEGRQIEGFVHRSSILEVKKLNNLKLKQLIIKVLDQQRNLANNFRNALESKNDSAYRTARKELEYHNGTKYTPMLTIVPKYFCETSDVEVIQLLFATSWADIGSANETLSFSIGDCFVCKTDIVIEQLKTVKDIEQKKYLLLQIEWGLLNHFSVGEDRTSDYVEFSKLKLRLDNELNASQ